MDKDLTESIKESLKDQFLGDLQDHIAKLNEEKWLQEKISGITLLPEDYEEVLNALQVMTCLAVNVNT